jgi:hypothetical protein
MAFREPIALAPARGPAGARLVAGHVDAAGPSLLPAGFLARLPREPARDDAVRLGETAAYRYADLRPRDWGDRQVDLYAAPTTAGVATLACIAPPRAGESFASACANVARTLELSAERAYPLGPDGGFAERLDRAMRTLAAQLVVSRRELQAAKRPAAQGRVAAELRGAYRRAADALGRERVSPAVAADRRAIEAALRRVATEYERLARAARSGEERSYDRARSAIRRAEADVRRALAQLDLRDYSVG